jgi:hypothetical protein
LDDYCRDFALDAPRPHLHPHGRQSCKRSDCCDLYDLGIKTFLNGQLVSTIVLDTSAAATDTIDYVATDPSGLTSTSTRTVVISSPTETASTTAQ